MFSIFKEKSLKEKGDILIKKFVSQYQNNPYYTVRPELYKFYYDTPELFPRFKKGLKITHQEYLKTKPLIDITPIDLLYIKDTTLVSHVCKHNYSHDYSLRKYKTRTEFAEYYIIIRYTYPQIIRKVNKVFNNSFKLVPFVPEMVTEMPDFLFANFIETPNLSHFFYETIISINDDYNSPEANDAKSTINNIVNEITCDAMNKYKILGQRRGDDNIPLKTTLEMIALYDKYLFNEPSSTPSINTSEPTSYSDILPRTINILNTYLEPNTDIPKYLQTYKYRIPYTCSTYFRDRILYDTSGKEISITVTPNTDFFGNFLSVDSVNKLFYVIITKFIDISNSGIFSINKLKYDKLKNSLDDMIISLDLPDMDYHIPHEGHPSNSHFKYNYDFLGFTNISLKPCEYAKNYRHYLTAKMNFNGRKHPQYIKKDIKNVYTKNKTELIARRSQEIIQYILNGETTEGTFHVHHLAILFAENEYYQSLNETMVDDTADSLEALTARLEQVSFAPQPSA